MGSRINGIQTGNIILSTVELNSNFNSSLKIFPNPATDIIFLDNIPSSKIPTCEIYNCFGQKVKSGNIINKSFPTTDLSNGLYFIRILSENGNALGKFVKD